MSENGGPAFPIHPGMVIDRQGVRETQGMTIRDWFAGQALVGYAANPQFVEAKSPLVASWAYEQADAMLAARNTGDNNED
jgi:hypothetical protein